VAINRRLLSLASGHVVLGIIASLLAPIVFPSPLGLRSILPPFGLGRILIVPLVASILCQALLLALWATTSGASPWWRLAGLVVGAVYLEALFPSDFRREFLGMSTIAVAVTTVALLVVRALGLRLTRPADPAQPARPELEGFQFSIRGLMLFTAAVAVLSAAARALQDSPRGFMLLVVVWAMCFVAVGVVALWAALGVSRPLRRGPIVFALSPVLGAFFATAAHAHRAGCVYILLIMLLYPTLSIGSLLVVRSCGYRFVRREVSSPEPPDEQTGSL
jgi:hypothetical protein